MTNPKNPYGPRDDWNRDEAWEDGYDAALEAAIKAINNYGDSIGWGGGAGDAVLSVLDTVEELREPI